MTELDKRIERTATNAYKVGYMDGLAQNGREEQDLMMKEATKELKSFFLEVANEIIGEDIALPNIAYAHTTDGRLITDQSVMERVDVANNVRAEQRKRAKELLEAKGSDERTT